MFAQKLQCFNVNTLGVALFQQIQVKTYIVIFYKVLSGVRKRNKQDYICLAPQLAANHPIPGTEKSYMFVNLLCINGCRCISSPRMSVLLCQSKAKACKYLLFVNHNSSSYPFNLKWVVYSIKPTVQSDFTSFSLNALRHTFCSLVFRNIKQKLLRHSRTTASFSFLHLNILFPAMQKCKMNIIYNLLLISQMLTVLLACHQR